MRFLTCFFIALFFAPSIVGAKETSVGKGSAINILPAPLVAPNCSVTNSDSMNCKNDEATQRLIKNAKEKEVPYEPPKAGLDVKARSIPCRMTADCPPGLFCSPSNVCSVTGMVGP